MFDFEGVDSHSYTYNQLRGQICPVVEGIQTKLLWEAIGVETAIEIEENIIVIPLQGDVKIEVGSPTVQSLIVGNYLRRNRHRRSPSQLKSRLDKLLKICSAPADVLDHMFKVRLFIWACNISLCRSAICASVSET